MPQRQPFLLAKAVLALPWSGPIELRFLYGIGMHKSKVETEPEVTLAAVLREALRKSPEIAEAKARSRAAREVSPADSRLPDPEVEYRLWGSRWCGPGRSTKPRCTCSRCGRPFLLPAARAIAPRRGSPGQRSQSRATELVS